MLLSRALKLSTTSRPIRLLSTVEIFQSNTPVLEARKKHKVPQKRASSILDMLKKEEYEALKGTRVYPDINAGDSIQVDKLLYVSSKEIVSVKGVVIGVHNKYSDTSISLINVELGVPVRRRISIYSPLIQSIKILQKAFIHNGKKRVRRAKLYYLLDRDVEEYTVK